MNFSLRSSAFFAACTILLLQQRHCSVDGVSVTFGFYPHGISSDDSLLEYSTAQDEPRYQTVNLTKNARFYGNLHKNITIGSDGVIAFGSQSPSYSSVPKPFPASGRPVLAPFWTEANYQNAGQVFYRVTNTSSLLQKAGEDITQAYSRVGVTRTVVLTELVIVTWKDLRSATHSNLGNTFQCIIAISSSSTYVFFLYDEGMMNWVGSSPALVGFNSGDGTRSFALPTSLTEGVLEVASTGNTGNAGKWIFQVDGSEVQMPGVIIGWAQTQLTAQENTFLELCASLLWGTLSQEERIRFTYSPGTTGANGIDDYTSRSARQVDIDPSDTSACRNLPINGDSYYEEDEVFYISLEGSTSIVFLPRTTTVTIMDDDPVFVKYGSITALEETGNVIIRAQLVDSSTGQSGCSIEKDVQVSYNTFPGDAEEGIDYHRASGTITINAPACSASARLTIIDDLIFEESERFHYNMSSADTAVRFYTMLPSADIIITDDDGRLVTIGMVQESYTALEGEAFTEVCAHMTSGSIGWPLTVSLQSAYHEGLIQRNLATDDVDLDSVNTQFTFLPGIANQMFCINVTTFTDGIYEGTEARGVSLINTLVVLNPEKSILEIIDVDGVTVSLERSHYNYKEGQTSGGLLPICANLTGEIERDLSIGVHFQPGTATSFNYVTDREGDVKVLPDNFAITFRVPGEGTKLCTATPCTSCSDLEIVNDNIVEEKFEEFTLTLSHDDLGAVALTSASILVVIEDDDTAMISVRSSESFTLEEDSTVVPTMTVTRSGMSDIDTIVRIVPLRGISATEDADYVANDNHIVIPPSNTERRVTASGRVGVTILDDLAVEGDETFELQIVTPDPDRLVVDTQDPIIVTITDNDNVLASYTDSSFRVSEGEGLVDVCVQMTGFAAVPLMVTVSTQPGTALVGIDFLSQSIPVLLPPTDQELLDAMYNLSVSERLHSSLPLSPHVCTNVSIIDDDILELVETKSFHLNLFHPDSEVLFTAPSTATVTITDNDNVTVVVDEASRNASATEGQDAHICARMLGRADFVIAGSFQTVVVPDSAQEGMDFVASLQTFVFPATSAAPQCFAIPTVEDSIVEGREKFKAELAIDADDNAKVVLGAESTAIITIEDNDFVEVAFEALEYSVIEGEGKVIVCAVLMGHLNVPVSIFFSVRDQPEQDQGDLDYTTIPSIPLFEGVSGESSQRECVNISISNDTILEDTEYFDVLLNSSDSAVRVTQGESRVYIIDDDGVRIGLTERALAVSEGDGESLQVCVELVGRIQSDIEVALETQANSAQADADYTAILTALTFTTSEDVEQEACIDASVVDDTIFENNESFKIVLVVEHSAVSIHIGEMLVTIMDDDHVTLSLTTSQATLPEDVGNWEVCVELADHTERDVAYQLDITALDAVQGADFLFTSASSSFPPTSSTSTSQCHQVTILDDAVLENTEHLEAELTAPGGIARVSIGTSVVRAAIIDDDSVIVGFSQTDFTVDEDEPQELSVRVCVEMTGEIEREVSVSVASEHGSADGSDFAAVGEELTFSPRPNLQRRQCFNVHVLEDRAVEEPETFFLVLSSNSLGVEFEPSRALFTITDNDVVCLATSLDTSRGYFTWEETFPGSSAEIQCENGSSIRVCSALGEWEKPIISDCYVSTNELFRYVEKHGFSEDNLKELLFAVLQLLHEEEEPSVRYVQIIEQIFKEFLVEVEADVVKVNTEMFTVMLEIMNAIQSWPQGTLQVSSPSIVSSFEEMSQGLFDVDGFTSLTTHLQSLSYLSKKAQISELFPQDITALQYLFSRNEEGDIEILNEDTDSDYEASITFPSSIVEHFTGGLDTGIVLTYYNSAVLFPFELNATQKEMEKMENVIIQRSVSPVVAATFTGQDIHDLKDNVIVTFTLELDNQPNVTCVSWDFGANGGHGNWVEDGCELISFEDGEVVCGCSHLTNYAILLEHTTSGPEARVMNSLSLLSIIGVTISLLGLAFTILTLVLFGKLRKRTNSKFRLQLCVAMILMLVFFVIGIYQTGTFEICVAASALLHYFTLVTAMWMFADALLMLLKLTLVISDPPTCFVVVVSLLCWLLPIPAVVVPIGIDTGFAISDEYCFISNTIVFFAALLGPIGAVLCLSLVIFLVAICTIIAYSTKHYKDTKKASKRRGACRSIFSNLGVMSLFGLAWVFGAFTIRGGPDYFKYLFVGFNSLQGLFVFIFFVVFAKETQSLWLQTCGCKQKKKRKGLMSAITGVVPPKPERMGLDADADRLRAMEEMDQDMRLGMTSWDIMFVVPQSQPVIPADTTPVSPGSEREQVSGMSSPQRSPDLESNLESTLTLNLESTLTPSLESNAETREDRSLDFNLESNTLHHGTSMLSQDTGILSQPHESTVCSPTHSLDSTQNAYECMSTADSGILMDKMKNSPTPPQDELQHPQSGSTSCHIHSVSGIGYVSADSSMEALPQGEEDCYYVEKRSEPIKLAPSLRPRAILNEYTRLDVDNPV